jgi:hypothetical protein
MGVISMRSRSFAEAPNVKIVYANDHFEFRDGSKTEIVHNRAQLGIPRGEPIGVYCVVKLKIGGEIIEAMDKAELEAFRDKYSLGKKYKSGPWYDPVEFWEMGKKTVLKKALKWVPINPGQIDSYGDDGQIWGYDEDTKQTYPINENLIGQQPPTEPTDKEAAFELTHGMNEGDKEFYTAAIEAASEEELEFIVAEIKEKLK